MTWTVDEIVSLLLLAWIIVLLVQSVLGIFKVKLSAGQLAGFILILAGVLWILAVLPSSPLQSFFTYTSLPDPWYVLGGLLIIYGIRYLLPSPGKDIVSAVLCVALVIGGFYLFKSLTPPPYWQGQQGETTTPEKNTPSLPQKQNNKHLFPAPLRIYSLRSVPMEALTWAEDPSSALSFHLNFGSLYVGQTTATNMGFGTYQFDVNKTATESYELVPQSGSEAGALFLTTQVKTVTIAASYGALYVEVTQPMERITVDSRMGDIMVNDSAKLNELLLKSYAGNIDIAINASTSTVSVESNAGNINIDTATVVPNVSVKASAGNLHLIVPTGVKVVVENVGSVNRLNNGSDSEGYNGTMKLYLDMRMGNVNISTEEP
jgi:hypothetical protein